MKDNSICKMERLVKIFVVFIVIVTANAIIETLFSDEMPNRVLISVKYIIILFLIIVIGEVALFGKYIQKLHRYVNILHIKHTKTVLELSNKNKAIEQMNEKLQAVESVCDQMKSVCDQMENETSLLKSSILDKDSQICRLHDELDSICGKQPAALVKEEIYRFINDKAIVKRFRTLAKEQQPAQESQWQIFDNIFDSFFPDFKQQLEARAKLTDGEFRICALVWLAFSPNEIGAVMGISKSNVSNRKRIGLKVFGEDMPVKQFDHKIRAITPLLH